MSLLVAIAAIGLFTAGLICGFILAAMLFANRGED